jgi:hypothetical protein
MLVDVLRGFPIAIAYRALQDCDRRPAAGREPEGGKDALRTFKIVGHAIGDAPAGLHTITPARAQSGAILLPTWRVWLGRFSISAPRAPYSSRPGSSSNLAEEG